MLNRQRFTKKFRVQTSIKKTIEQLVNSQNITQSSKSSFVRVAIQDNLKELTSTILSNTDETEKIQLIYDTRNLIDDECSHFVKLISKLDKETVDMLDIISERGISKSEVLRQCILKEISTICEHSNENTQKINDVWRRVSDQYQYTPLDNSAGCVYVLSMKDGKGQKWFYTGMVDVESSIRKRMREHMRNNGDFSKSNTYANFTDISIYQIDVYSQKTIGGNNSYKFLRNKERETSYRIAIEENTTNVLGGK
jgi:hypothetical protein